MFVFNNSSYLDKIENLDEEFNLYLESFLIFLNLTKAAVPDSTLSGLGSCWTYRWA